MKSKNIEELIRYSMLMGFPGLFSSQNPEKTISDIVVTLTTLPSRIKNIEPTIASLCHQTVLPAKILINIPEYSRREKKGYQIPPFLANNPLVEVNSIEKDQGPITKLLPALEKYHNKKSQILLVVDDDEVYPKRLIENYLNYEELSRHAVLTLVGWNAPADFVHANKIVLYGAIGNKPKNSRKITQPTRVDCVQGASSYLVRPSFFDSTIFDFSQAPKEAFFVDDIHVSGHLAKQMVPIYVVPASFRYARMKVTTHLIRSEALHKKENKTGYNNQVLYSFYKNDWVSMNAKTPVNR